MDGPGQQSASGYRGKGLPFIVSYITEDELQGIPDETPPEPTTVAQRRAPAALYRKNSRAGILLRPIAKGVIVRSPDGQ